MANFDFMAYTYGTHFPAITHEGQKLHVNLRENVTPGTIWEDASNSIRVLKNIPANVVPMFVTIQNADFDDATDLDVELEAIDAEATGGANTFILTAAGGTTFQAAANTTYALQGGASSSDVAMAGGDCVEDFLDAIANPSDATGTYDIVVDITTAAGSGAGNTGELAIEIEFLVAGTPLTLTDIKNSDIAGGQA